MDNKVIGIIGGMGPEATADLYLKIIKATKASRDQDHFHVIIDSNPKTPDRTQAILYNGESPVNTIVKAGKNLELLGVNIGCISCITSHYFFDEIQKELSYPILNALEETKKYIVNLYPNTKKIGVMATSGTIKAGLFDKYLSDFNIIYLDEVDQKEKVMKAIYSENGIKSGNTGEYPYGLLKEASDKLIDLGAEIIISGCTEIALVLKPSSVSVPLIDPMQVIAEVLVSL